MEIEFIQWVIADAKLADIGERQEPLQSRKPAASSFKRCAPLLTNRLLNPALFEVGARNFGKESPIRDPEKGFLYFHSHPLSKFRPDPLAHPWSGFCAVRPLT
jgi:hypothetical protein